MALAVAAGGLASAAPAQAQNEQFIPQLVYRTGPFSPNGVPVANGILDYYTLINERDGGINGVKILVEECEFGYATDRGVECYERLKAKGPTGAAFFHPFSTGVTFALTEKTTTDKIPLLTVGYGRADSQNGGVFQWNFPLMGTYWSSGDVAIQHIAKKEGGLDKLKGKKITLVYHDSPAGKESIPVLQKRAAMHGFEFNVLPVTHPGIEQKATWLQIRQARPDWILLWGWGVMNSTAIKEAVAVGFPREKMLGWWWSGAEPDVKPAEDGAKGFSSLAMQHSAGRFKLHEDLKKHVFDKAKTQGKWEDSGDVLYNRGLAHGDARHRGHPQGAGEVREEAAQGRGSPLGSRKSRSDGSAHQGAGLRGRHRPGQAVVRRSRGHQPCPRPYLGRQGMEDLVGLVRGRQGLDGTAGQGNLGQVRRGKEDHAGGGL